MSVARISTALAASAAGTHTVAAAKVRPVEDLRQGTIELDHETLLPAGFRRLKWIDGRQVRGACLAGDINIAGGV